MASAKTSPAPATSNSVTSSKTTITTTRELCFGFSHGSHCVAFCGKDGANGRGRIADAAAQSDYKTTQGDDDHGHQSIDTIADIAVPDTALVREVTEFIRDAEDDLLFNHSRRVFLFGALQGRRRGLQPDLELLYAGAMFHDLGLTERYRTSTLRFEVDGANAARDFLLERGVDKADADKVWLGIALHTTPGVPEFLAPEVALVHRRCRNRRGRHRPRRSCSRGACRGHRRPPAPGFQAAHPGGVQRRHEAPAATAPSAR